MRWSDGETEHPYGADAKGLLVYTATGHVSGHLMRLGVPRFGTGARRAPASQTREAFLGYLGYFGTYEVDAAAGTVTHTVVGGWHPNWVGTRQVRHFQAEGRRLVITTPPVKSGRRSRVTRIEWERIPSQREDSTDCTML